MLLAGDDDGTATTAHTPLQFVDWEGYVRVMPDTEAAEARCLGLADHVGEVESLEKVANTGRAGSGHDHKLGAGSGPKNSHVVVAAVVD